MVSRTDEARRNKVASEADTQGLKMADDETRANHHLQLIFADAFWPECFIHNMMRMRG
jgi:hypothetical protein